MQTLAKWYLARLRRSSGSTGLTPQAMVETDRAMIQELVAQYANSYEDKSNEYLQLLQGSAVRTPRDAWPLAIAALGAVILFCICVA